MTQKPATTFGHWEVSSFIVITSNLELNSTCRKKEHSQFRWNTLNRTTHTNLDVLQENPIDDYWTVDTNRSLSESWTVFTKFTLLNEKTSQRVYVFRRGGFLKIQADCLWQKQLRRRSSMRGNWEASIIPIRKMERKRKPLKTLEKLEVSRWWQESAERKLRETASETTESNKKDKPCMYRGGSWIHEKAFGNCSTPRSWRPHLREWVRFVDSLQKGSPLCYIDGHLSIQSKELESMWTEHPHTTLILDTFILVHTSHCGSRCRTTGLHGKRFMHVSSHVWAFVVSLFSLFPLSLVPLLSLVNSTCPLSWTSTSMMSRTPSIKPNAHPQNEKYCRGDNQLDNFDYSETSAAIFQDESVDIDTEPSYSCDAELDDDLIGKALSSPLFTHERENQRTWDKLITSHEESLLPAQSLFTRTSAERPVYEPSSDLSQKRKSSRDSENERILLERQKEQILAKVISEIQKHELQADSDRRSVQELPGIIDSQRMESDHTITGCEQSRWDQLLFQEELSEQNRDLRETRIKNLHEIEELKRVQEIRIDEFSRRRLIENQDTVDELTAKTSGMTEWSQLHEWLGRF